LSVLVKKGLIREIQAYFTIPPPIIGSSTIAAMNFFYHRSLSVFHRFPQLMIQMAEGLVVVTAHNRSIPFYIRKFKLQNPQRLTEDIAQVKNFLLDRYSRQVKTFTMVTSDPRYKTVSVDEFSRLDLTGRLVNFSRCLEGLK
jgi:hypothetical protein